MEIKLLLGDRTTGKSFYKYFDTEYEKQKFIAKLKYSKKLVVLDNCYI